MRIIDIPQGYPEWRARRLRERCASEAAAVMGASKHLRRNDLIRMKALGLEKEFSDYVQTHVLDPGHVAEAGSRALVEQGVGPLYPVCGTTDDGYLWASLDGMTIDDETVFESKRWNEDLAAQVRRADLEPHYYWQLEQELLVSGASRVIFACSDGVPERHLTMEYRPVQGRAQQLLDGWRQFDADVAAYVEPEPAAPAPTGRAPDTLPALRIEVTGAVTASNLAEFKATALSAIRSVNRDLRTDQDFADADKAVKWCADVESRLKAAKEHALSQTADIDALFKTLDDISAEARSVRLDVEKLVKRRKDEVREHAVSAAVKALNAHIATLNAELAPMRLLSIPADFAGPIKGLRSIDSMQNALDTTLAQAKIVADNQARLIRANVAVFKAAVGDDRALQALFADLGTLVHKPLEDFATLVEARIAKHRADEAEREAKRKAAEDARIAAAEAKARADEAARIEREQAAAAEALQRAQAAPVAPTPAPAPIAAAPAGVQAPPPTLQQVLQSVEPAEVAAAMAPRADEPATLKLGEICSRLGFNVTAAFLGDVLHIRPAGKAGASVLFRESQWPVICRQLQAHVGAMAELYTPEVATA